MFYRDTLIAHKRELASLLASPVVFQGVFESKRSKPPTSSLVRVSDGSHPLGIQDGPQRHV
jgi:hypothetical protein